MNAHQIGLLLANRASLGSRAIERLLSINNPWERLAKDPIEVAEEARLTAAASKRLLDALNEGFAEEEVQKVMALKGTLSFFGDPSYPASLLSIPSPPLVLYSKGSKAWPRNAVAIVGARRSTRYGIAVARELGYIAARAGIEVISGLARGVDQEAHLGTLEGRGIPIAVLGCGIDRVYPPESSKLFDDVVAHGRLVSEYPLSTPPKPENFPRRNRLICGLSRALIVVEASVGSGSLITAQHALEQGRDVIAVPGPIDSPTSRGTNELIRDGAIPLIETSEIVEILGWNSPADTNRSRKQQECSKDLSAPARKILSRLETTDATLDEICDSLDLELGVCLELLGELIDLGCIREEAGAVYSLN